ncbi:MAG: magnesium transporter, partial [Lachnospiraceae bacterium]|nr:magnesium transporter [Lachnospiraceae bacterium]
MEKRIQDYQAEILAILRGNLSPGVLRSRLEDYHENDLAEVLTELSATERKRVFRILDTEFLSDIFEYTEEEDTARYLDEMNLQKAAAILSRM